MNFFIQAIHSQVEKTVPIGYAYWIYNGLRSLEGDNSMRNFEHNKYKDTKTENTLLALREEYSRGI